MATILKIEITENFGCQLISIVYLVKCCSVSCFSDIESFVIFAHIVDFAY